MSGRASREERGYGRAHIAERKRWQRVIDREPVPCAKPTSERCIGTIPQGSTDWDLGHTEDRTGYVGPQCVPCNRSDGGKRGAATTNAKRTDVFRDWV